MKRLLLFVFGIAITITVMSQEKKKFGINIKKPNFNIGESLGNLAGKLMTSSTDQLDGVVIKATIISGIYPPEIETTESKFFPPGSIEGDYGISISFMKGSGMGMYKIDGTVECEGVEMEYVSLGSYLATFRTPFTDPKKVVVRTNGGDIAEFELSPVSQVQLIAVNGENAMPVIDLSKDFEITYSNPYETLGAKIKISFLTTVMGVKALNHFATFDAKTGDNISVTIPKESLSNPEVSGSIKGIGNYNKGENFLIIEKTLVTERDKMGPEQKLGEVQTAEFNAVTYSSMPVLVKGEQDESVYSSIKVNQKQKNGIGYTMYKPNANTGIPFSKGSKFGLASLTLEGSTFKQETQTSERYGYGNTRIITTTTTTYQFPQLPNSYWEYVLGMVYDNISEFLKSEYNIEFVPVENVTNASDYTTLFPAADTNTEKIIRTSYKNTQRTQAKSIGEIVGSVSSNNTSDNSMVNMMKEADVDGLLSVNVSFSIGGNKDRNVILIPTLSFQIIGRDEDNNNKQGTYANGYIVLTTGKPFNENLAKTKPEALAIYLSVNEMLEAFYTGIRQLRQKEVELGYDKIWNIGK